MKKLTVFVFTLLATTISVASAKSSENALLKSLDKNNVVAFKKDLGQASSDAILEALRKTLVQEDSRFLKILLKDKKALATLDAHPELAALPVQEGQKKNLELLVAAKPKIVTQAILEKNRRLLYEAVTNADLELIRYVIAQDKSAVTAVDEDGESALFAAGRRGDREIATYLVGLGIDRGIKNKQGQTAADVALAADFPKTSAILKAP